MSGGPASRTMVVCIVVAVGIAAGAFADEAPPAGAPHPVPEPPGVHPTIDEVRAHDADTMRRVYALGRVQIDYPRRLTASSGFIVTRLPRDFDCTTTCLIQGPTVHGTLGLSGAGLAVGYGSLVGETGASGSFLRHAFVGWGARAAYLRTWRGAWDAPEGADYAGVEAAATAAQFALTFGVYRHVGAGAPEADWRVFFGAGWGF